MPDTFAPLVWDDDGKKIYETGVKKGVLFVMKDDGTYDNGVAWNGLTGVTESNTGGDENALWADDIKYGSLRSAEEFGATIEAYQCPREFYQCDGCAEPAPGVIVGQQTRRKFAFSYVTTVGNDIQGTGYGYRLNIIYGATASPSERQYQTMNDSPDAMTLSWEITTTPINVAGMKPVAHITIESAEADSEKLTALEAMLYGSSTANSTLPLPATVFSMMGEQTQQGG